MELLSSLVFALAALIVLVIALRCFDILAGGWSHFKRPGGPLSIIHSDPRAAGLYYGLRFIGAAIVVGLVVSSVRFGL
jgi:hypothetical protein